MKNILYELRPFLLVIGAFMASELSSPIKWISIIMLVLASLLIMERRYYHRVISKRPRTYD